MNTIPSHIIQISRHNGCALVQLQCSFGTLYSLVLEPCEFEIHNEVMATFKENEIILSHHKFISQLNTFQAHIASIQSSGFFTRLSLVPDTQDTLQSPLIYATFLSLSPMELSQHQPCIWHIPSSHILLEKKM